MAGSRKELSSVSEALVFRRVRVAARDVVLVKGICEASEGLCAMFAERGGDLVLCASASRARDLDELVNDLCADFAAEIDVNDIDDVKLMADVGLAPQKT
jgi:hypothetical protein